MPFTTGTHSDYLDLLDQLVTYATGLGGGEAWTLERNEPSGFGADTEVWLSGPGLAGGEAILVGIKTETSAGRFAWRLNGATAYDEDADFAAMPGSIPEAQGTPFLLLAGSGTSNHTFIVNGRRIIVIAYNGAVAQVAYLGLIDAYGPPVTGRYLYPLLISGMNNDETKTISDTGTTHGWGFKHRAGNNQKANGHLYSEGLGDWRKASNPIESPSDTHISDGVPRFWINPPGQMRDDHLIGNLPNGDSVAYDCEVCVNSSSKETLVGRLDGIAWASGIVPLAGVTINIDGTDWIGVPNAFRSGVNDFLLFKLA